MCGINGVYHFKNSKSVSEPAIKKMRDSLIHRGPDSAGIYISPDKKVGLGHRRLAIIDLSPTGHQPMANEDKTIWIVYNGEIYNFQELRPDLEKKGHIFRSKSDTEVIIHAYEEYGFDCVKKFNGMFAFVIWDEKKKILFAARDHLGIKPFYYAIQNGSFYFGSEIKAILAHPDFKKELEENNVSHYLTFSCMPSPHTLFKNIKKLPAAHYLTIKAGGITHEVEYWNPVSGIRNQELGIRNQNELEEYFVNETRRLLRDSIKSQMVSDVAFGCFLSGGIDSSTNAVLMSRALGRPVETFSVGFERHDKYNEFQYSRQTAKLIGAKTHEILINEKHLEEFLPKYAFHADDPNGDPVCLPLFWLSKMTRENGVIMIQIGEGADEIFAGYELYLKALKLYGNLWQWLEKFPAFAKKGLFKATTPFVSDFHKEYLRRLAANQEPFWGTAVAFSDYQKENLLSDEYKTNFYRSSSYDAIKNYYDELKEIDNSADFLKRTAYLEIKHRLPEFLLARADKMTMAHSIEGRVPFLEKQLVELAMQIPAGIKLKNNETKHVLKEAVKGIIPEEIINRKKQGFGTPISEWLRAESPIREKLINIIKNSELKERNILNYDYVGKLIYAHQHQKAEHSFRIWNLITLSLWYDYWFK